MNKRIDDNWFDIWRRFGEEVVIPITGVTPDMLREWLEENYEAPKRYFT